MRMKKIHEPRDGNSTFLNKRIALSDRHASRTSLSSLLSKTAASNSQGCEVSA